MQKLYLLDVFKIGLQPLLGDEVKEVVAREDVDILGVDPRHAFHVQHLEPLEARQAGGQRAQQTAVDAQQLQLRQVACSTTTHDV